jgi:[ribosomal protein S5]-alanine N-acetyltransferase
MRADGSQRRAPVITLTRCRLRPWRAGDEESLVRHANNRNVWINLRDRFPHPYTEADAVGWIAMASQESPVLHFAIEVDGEAAGGIGLELQPDVFRRSAEIGYWLGEKHWGRGIATEAVRAMTAYAFETLEICRVFGGVFDPNPGSARVLEKAGYTLEGRLRRAAFKDGKPRDQLLYAYVVEER